MPDKKERRIMQAIMSERWAIMPESLHQIVTIAERNNESPESLAAKRGEKLEFTRNVEMREGVAIIPVSGPIFRYANLFTEFSGGTSLDILAKDFNKVINDPTVKSIVLDIDSPGGQVSGINEFSNMIYEARGTVPITAYIGGMGASAAYWIASAADQIIIDDTALAGSVGVVTTVDNRKPDGIIEIVSSQSPHKRVDAGADDGRQQIQTVVDNLADIFIGTVARNRGVSVDTVLSDFGQGGVFVGAKAIDAGMVDSLGSLESVIAGITGSKQEVFIMSDDKKTPVISRESIAADHPDIATAFRDEGATASHDASVAAGATAERERIESVMAQGKKLPGHTALIESLAFDGKTTGPEAAVELLGAEEKARLKAIEDRKGDAPEVVPAVDAADESEKVDASLPVEKRCEATWDKDPKIRAEFKTLETYTAYQSAVESGQSKQFKG